MQPFIVLITYYMGKSQVKMVVCLFSVVSGGDLTPEG